MKTKTFTISKGELVALVFIALWLITAIIIPLPSVNSLGV
jgi:hypothetical protein